MKYNNQNVEFDTLINVTNGLNYLYYLNPNDSTLRFTSYRLGQMQNDSAVVWLRFSSLSGYVCVNDLNSLTGYLNGDQCSYKVTDCDTISTQAANIQGKDAIAMYPNPANQFLYLKIQKIIHFKLSDVIRKYSFDFTKHRK
ncbi:MAG: hypothetical protein IPP71_13295 [Bacteroidetes bacterium]|nr:hypothetical protein [Bacteroidota bacterium]